MLSYQHIYHAGNFADVHKHLLLTAVLLHLNRKPAPWTAFETHAGDGLYDLGAAEAMKTGEAGNGIQRFLKLPGLAADRREVSTLPAWVWTYVDLVRDCLRHEHYPGSPELTQRLSRPAAGDRQILCELHPGAYQALRGWARLASDQTPAGHRRGGRPSVHQRDGFEGVAAMTPPAAGRGLVLIDPSYEIKSDYERIPDWIQSLVTKWRSATVLLWYPLLEKPGHADLIQSMKSSLAGTGSDMLFSEWRLAAQARAGHGMTGSGMLLINPPWTLANDLVELESLLGTSTDGNDTGIRHSHQLITTAE